MHIIDLLIFIVYMILMLGVGYYFMRKNKTTDDYYVGGRGMGSVHIGLSVVATDVGGGFSIGLGGLGFAIGLSGSWMLFTGLVGAWLSAVILIPEIRKLSDKYHFLTFPQVFGNIYNKNIALLAGIISAIGYIGFTSSQILAGAKLAAASFISLNQETALIIMGAIAVIYTFMGGLKAVIYTDTIQWLILIIGLIFIGIPIGYQAIGGYEEIKAVLQPEFLQLNNISWQIIVKWAVTIIPIWFVGMTLYQRIYASKGEKQAKRAWFLAGLFEYPIMAFMGVILGLFGRVAFEQGLFAEMGYFSGMEQMDPEMGLPLLLRTVLPVGLMGLMMAAYFSAIMSTADSCLMAASGNILTDIIQRFKSIKSKTRSLRISQMLTLIIGVLALFLAFRMKNVLDLMLYSYAFLVSGLFIPLIAGLFSNRKSIWAAFFAMISGGSATVYLTLANIPLSFGLDPNVFGILISLFIFLSVRYFYPGKLKTLNES